MISLSRPIKLKLMWEYFQITTDSSCTSIHTDFLHFHNFAYFYFSPEKKRRKYPSTNSIFFLFTDYTDRNAIKKYYHLKYITGCTTRNTKKIKCIAGFTNRNIFRKIYICSLYNPQYKRCRKK